MSTYRINDNGTERDMTAAEVAAHEQTVAEARAEAQAAAAAADDVARARASALAKLAALGLSDDEIAALLS
jgi:hypothetical protein